MRIRSVASDSSSVDCSDSSSGIPRTTSPIRFRFLASNESSSPLAQDQKMRKEVVMTPIASGA